MKGLQQRIIRVRAAARRARARLGGTDPASMRPARLVLRLDDADLPGSLGEGAELALADWQRLLVDAIAWLGPLPVTVLAGQRGDHRALVEVVRFAHRLECPTAVVCDGGGLGAQQAAALLDAGLDAARVRVGGVSEAVHQAVVGGDIASASGAVRAFLEARRSRAQPLDVEVVVPWSGPADQEVRAVMGWAQQLGCDGLRINPPWRAAALPCDPELLDAITEADDGFRRTPHAAVNELHGMVADQDGGPGRSQPRARRRCPVGGQRLEISARGRLSCCPFKAPIPRGDTLKASWLSGGAAHLQEIAGCSRSCAHVELAPAPILAG